MATRRELLKWAGTAAAAAGLGACASPGSTGGKANKTYVLVHGAWHGGWCWRGVGDRLRSAGHQVYAPSQSGLGERSHLVSRTTGLEVFIQDFVNLIEAEELTDVILVGHSIGGITITGVADRIPRRLRHLVYLDALILQNGQSIFDVFPPAVRKAREDLAQRTSGGVSFPPPGPEIFAVADPQDQAWLKRRMQPQPLASYAEKLRLSTPVIGNGVPKTYVTCTQPLFKPQEPTRQWLKTQTGWGMREIATGHDAMVTAPQALADLLADVA